MKLCTFAATVLFTSGMAMPQAQANTVISTTFTLSSGGTYSTVGGVADAGLTYTSGGVTLALTGYSCGSTTVLCDSVPTRADSTSALNESSSGVGLANDSVNGVDEIPRNEYVQLDFSSLPAGATITSVTFNMKDVVDGWEIYTSTVAGEFDSTSAAAAAIGTNGDIGGFSNLNSSITGGASSGSSTLNTNSAGFYNVTALQADCETLLTSVTVDYSMGTPEPATFLLMGGALLGLGAAGKKLRRR